jgi:hypothetical protein
MFNYSNPCLSGLGLHTHGFGMVGVLTAHPQIKKKKKKRKKVGIYKFIKYGFAKVQHRYN